MLSYMLLAVVVLVVAYTIYSNVTSEYKKSRECVLWDSAACAYVDGDTGTCFYNCDSITNNVSVSELGNYCDKQIVACVKQVDVYTNKKYLK